MRISEYKNILFIEDSLDIGESKQQNILIETKGMTNQLKNLDIVKDEMIQCFDDDYNVIFNFRYGQKEKIIAFDDICFYGKGIASKLDQDEYERLKHKIVYKKLELVNKVKNETVYDNAPVQIDKYALYFYEKQYLGQIQFYNASDEKIKNVKVEITLYNPLHEILATMTKDIPSHSQTDSFGDDVSLLFDCNDIASFDVHILEVQTSDHVYDYQHYESLAIKRFQALKELYDDESLLVFKTHFSIKEDKLFMPCILGNYGIDCNGNMTKDIERCQSIVSYLHSSQFTKDVEKYKEEEQEGQRHLTLEQSLKDKRRKKIRNILLVVLGIAIVLMFPYLQKKKDAETIEKQYRIEWNQKIDHYLHDHYHAEDFFVFDEDNMVVVDQDSFNALIFSQNDQNIGEYVAYKEGDVLWTIRFQEFAEVKLVRNARKSQTYELVVQVMVDLDDDFNMIAFLEKNDPEVLKIIQVLDESFVDNVSQHQISYSSDDYNSLKEGSYRIDYIEDYMDEIVYYKVLKTQ